MKQNKDPRNESTHIWSNNLQQRREEYTTGKGFSSVSGARKTGQVNAKD